MTPPLIFFSEPDQVDSVHAQDVALLTAATIISLDIDVSARLRQLGYEFSEITDLLTLEEINELRSDAQCICATWFAPLALETYFDGYNPAKFDQYVPVHFFQQALIASAVFKRAMASFPADSVVIFENEQRPITLDDHRPDVANAVWLFLAERHRLRVIHVIKAENQRTQENRKSRLIHLGRRFIDAGLAWLTNPLLFSLLQGRIRQAGRQPVMFLISYREASRYNTIAHKVKQHLGSRFLTLNTSHFRRVQYRVGSERLSWYPLPTLLPEWWAWRARKQLKRIYNHWTALQKVYDGVYPEILANPHLDFQFRYMIIQRLSRSVQAFLIACHAFRALKPCAVLTTSVSIEHQAEILEAARQLGIPTGTMPHSGTPVPAHHTLSAENMIVWTSDFNDGVDDTDQDRLVIAGLPEEIVYHGYDYDQPLAQVSGKKMILVLTTLDATLSISVEPERHQKSLESLVSIPVRLLSQVRLILKLHPGSVYRYIYEAVRLAAPQDALIEIIKFGAIGELVRQADVVVLANMPTSAYLVPLLEQKPLLYIHTASLTGWPFALAAWDGPSVIRRDEDIWPSLEQVLFSEDKRQAILADNRRFAESIQLHRGDPIQLIVQTLEKLADGHLTPRKT